MKELCFEWDESKSKSNRKKHGVTFDEAQEVFFDPDHSEDEERFILLGMSYRLRVLVVCHCHRKNDTVIRMISARKATKNEAKNYGR